MKLVLSALAAVIAVMVAESVSVWWLISIYWLLVSLNWMKKEGGKHD